MESTESTAAWTENMDPVSPKYRLLETSTATGRHTVAVYKMRDENASGVVVRELWLAGEPEPQNFHSDRDLDEAIQTNHLPALEIEKVRRSVAATMQH